VEGLHEGAERDVAAARDEIVALLAEFQPAATTTAHALSARATVNPLGQPGTSRATFT
jgi:hypothetical protein